ncbi:hypothetical protein SAMN06296241_0618 [Salinimicrobium sediminis]|uniref:Uncharacterized protein n=1 Tax=Salinimicrobium sediminis TaxID=1343891 RepID=A0A285X1D4_9FLAO|nr:hypothetical protein SAMN06296241_0618 [Salinimicrobium sediminis]
MRNRTALKKYVSAVFVISEDLRIKYPVSGSKNNQLAN